MSVDHVDNARRERHGERNNSKDDGEGLAGPTDGLIQRLLLIWEGRIIGPHVRDGIVVRLCTGACRADGGCITGPHALVALPPLGCRSAAAPALW